MTNVLFPQNNDDSTHHNFNFAERQFDTDFCERTLSK